MTEVILSQVFPAVHFLQFAWVPPELMLWLCEIEKLVTTVYPKKYAHGFCFAVLCCGYTLTDFPISVRLTSLWQSNDCPSASKATLMNMDKYFMWIHYERLHNHNKAKHNKTVCIFLGIYCIVKKPLTYLYTSHISACQCLTANSWEVSVGEVRLAHLSCTLLAYSSMGLTITWYWSNLAAA